MKTEVTTVQWKMILTGLLGVMGERCTSIVLLGSVSRLPERYVGTM